MTQQHPITPPPELVEQWRVNTFHYNLRENMIKAAQWGADQELEACCEWLGKRRGWEDVSVPLRAERRPKPSSLKEQALALINHDPANQPFLSDKGIDTIRRALEQLPDHE
jgi:hypothetical protein